MDQLRQVLDGVDVMVRRRGDESHSWRRMANLGDPRIHFVARQLPPFARLGALGHLDLQFLGIYEINAGDAETAGSHLLDRAVLGIAVRLQYVALRVFAALASVA